MNITVNPKEMVIKAVYNEFQKNLDELEAEELSATKYASAKNKIIRDFEKKFTTLAKFRKGDIVGHNGDKYSRFKITKTWVEYEDIEMRAPEVVHRIQDQYIKTDYYEATEDELFLIERYIGN